MIARRWISIAVAAILMVGASGGPLMAQTAIKVVVNGKPITTYDISQRAKLLRLTTGKGGSAASRAAQEELIDEQLKKAEAARLGITVSKSDVDNAFGNIAQRVKLSPKQLVQALRQSGITPDTLRNRLEAEIGWTQILRARFQSEVSIPEADIIAALQRKVGKETDKSKEYSVRSVIFVVPGKSSAGQKAARKREAEQFRSRLNGCEQADDLSKNYREVVVMPMRTRLETEVPQQIRDLLDKTPVGKATSPQASDKGYEMFAVCEKREIASNAAARMEIEDELRAKEGQQMSRRLMREMRSRAIIDYR
ncbi:SurA N-terminal domain-containing protein [Stappia sp.]|uniref:SurA N-terminal domain-containing protein n=1 Tax=Stappia sp. TaxID=1870903 RepID=UPI003A990E9B